MTLNIHMNYWIFIQFSYGSVSYLITLLIHIRLFVTFKHLAKLVVFKPHSASASRTRTSAPDFEEALQGTGVWTRRNTIRVDIPVEQLIRMDGQLLIS